MRFVSTRGQSPAVPISQAILQGAAPDGGLYLPAEPARLDAAALDPGLELPALAEAMLRPFFEGDPLAPELDALCAEAFRDPTPLVAPDPARPGLRALELFHGPTAAFKDFGARLLMACLSRLGQGGAPLTVLVATSGDTGGAVGCAAEGRENLRVFILYPKGRVSPFQAHQLGCWNRPVQALEIEGDFDACQQLVKAAFADPTLSGRHRLTSANSINIGRLLPQMVWFGQAALRLHAETGVAPGLLVPTGNLGHGVAAVMARALGLPIGPIVAVTNANAALHDWSAAGTYRPRPSVATIANAMDVGAPSNFERLAYLPAADRALRVELVRDEVIRARIRRDHQDCGYVWCPHSATAAEAYGRLPEDQRSERPWVAVATAHPYKFADIVEPIIDEPLEPPAALAATLARSSSAIPTAATLDAVRERLA